MSAEFFPLSTNKIFNSVARSGEKQSKRLLIGMHFVRG